MAKILQSRWSWIGAICVACPALQGASAELKLELGHSKSIGSVAISHDGRQVLTGSDDGSARLWDVATGREIRLFQGLRPNPRAAVVSVAFSPDERSILTGSTLRTGNAVAGLYPDVVAGAMDKPGTRLWDLATGREIRHFEGDAGSRVSGVAFSPDGRSVLATEGDSAQLWDVATGSEIRRFTGHTDSVQALAFSRDGHLILTGSRDKTVRLWDVATGRQVRRFDGLWVSSVAFSRDGHSALTTEGDKAQLWDLATGRETRSFRAEPEEATPAPGPATIKAGRGIEPGSISSAAFSPDGRLVLAGIEDNTARLWDVATGHEVRRFRGHSEGVTAVAFAAEGLSVLTGGYDHTARLWDVATGREIRRFEGYADPAESIAFTPDGHAALVGSVYGEQIFDRATDREIQSGHTARLWDLTTGRETGRFGDVRSAAVAPDGRAVVTAGSDGIARVNDSTGREIRHFDAGAFSAMVLSPDGQSLIAGGYGSRTAWLLDPATGREMQRFESHSSDIRSVTFSPDGRSALTNGELWDVVTGREIRRFDDIALRQAHPVPLDTIDMGFGVESSAFSADGRLLLTGNSDYRARLWDVTKGDLIGEFEGGYGIAALSPQGDLVLTGSADRIARLRDVASGREIHRFEHALGFAAFFPGGRFIVIGGDDGLTRVWETGTWRLVATLVSYRAGGWAVVAPDGRFDTSELDGASALYWIADDQPDRPLPLEIFMRQYFTPRLLPRLLAGETLPPLPGIASLNRVPPEVNIAKLEPDPRHAGTVRATVRLKSRGGARDLRLFRGGQLVDFREGVLKGGEYVFGGIRLPHVGPNEPIVFTAYAFNSDLVKSPTAERSYTAAATSGPERRARAFLVEIGINRVAARGCNLQYAAADATAMQESLRQRLEAAGYTVESQLLLADSRQPDGSSKERVRSALANIASRATPDDVFLMTYSGHGYTDTDGAFYLFPSDLRGDCSKVDRVLKQSAISADELTKWVRPIDAGEMAIVLDACYSAASIESGDFRPGPMGSRGLGQLAYDKRIRVLTASQATQPAGEAGAIGMGYLSYALVKNGLEANDADWQPKDGAIWLREWLAYGVERVPRLYESVRGGGSLKGIIVNRKDTLSLQRPALFDFRTPQDRGPRLK